MTKEQVLDIKALESGHERQWRRLWSEYLEFYKTSVPDSVYAETFGKLVSYDEKSCAGYIAFLDDEAVGLVHCVYHVDLWQTEQVCYLHDLYTAPHLRGRGVGRALIETVYERASARNVSVVYWVTHESNHAARRLYDGIAEQTGFIKYQKK